MIRTADKIAIGAKETSVGNKTIVYLRQRPEGDVLIVEEVRTKRKKLAFCSMRKAKAGYTYDLDSPGHTIKKRTESQGVNVQNDTQPEAESPYALSPEAE